MEICSVKVVNILAFSITFSLFGHFSPGFWGPFGYSGEEKNLYSPWNGAPIVQL
jgi:hypothetical protein